MLQSNDARGKIIACVIDWKTEDTFVILLLLPSFFPVTAIVHSIYVSDKKIKNVTVRMAVIKLREE